MAQTSLRKDVNEIIGEVRKNGFQVVKGGKHWKVLKNGAIQRDEQGPLVISGSPSDVRVIPLTRTRLERAGVLKKEESPRKNQKVKHERTKDEKAAPLKDPAVRAKVIEANKEASRRRQQRTASIRARWEPLISLTGGWKAMRGKAGSTREWGEVFFYFNRDRVERPTTLDACLQKTRLLHLGSTMSDSSAVCWELLLDDLESYQEKDKIRDRFFELLRAAKGLVEPQQVQPAPLPEREEEEPKVEDSVEREWHPIHELNGEIPSLALRAVALMMQGKQTEDVDLEEVVRTGERIARMEMKR